MNAATPDGSEPFTMDDATAWLRDLAANMRVDRAMPPGFIGLRSTAEPLSLSDLAGQLKPPRATEARMHPVALEALELTSAPAPLMPGHLGAYLGIPVMVDSEMTPGAWEIRSGDEVISKGNVLPATTSTGRFDEGGALHPAAGPPWRIPDWQPGEFGDVGDVAGHMLRNITGAGYTSGGPPYTHALWLDDIPVSNAGWPGPDAYWPRPWWKRLFRRRRKTPASYTLEKQ